MSEEKLTNLQGNSSAATAAPHCATTVTPSTQLYSNPQTAAEVLPSSTVQRGRRMGTLRSENAVDIFASTPAQLLHKAVSKRHSQ
jgi:hypothetical protein